MSAQAPTAADQSQQPSKALMQQFDDEQPDEAAAAPQRRQSRGTKQARGGAALPAAAPSTGNNSSEPVLSAKAERALRKQQQAANSRAQTSRHSKSRSPSSGNAAHHSSTQHRDESDRHPDKKKPMRDCQDVLNRIRHDAAYEDSAAPSADATVAGAKKANFLSHFLIAYIDRVWGDQEIPFDEFFSNSDYKDIPLHRVSYIRFFDEIIWNRAARFDAVFGSSNSTKTLPDWLAETPKLKAAQELRWAILLAQEAAEAARDQRMLSQLGVQIAEQRDEIDAMQNRAEVASAATSGFDFTETAQRQRMQDVEDAEIEAMEAEDALQREVQAADDNDVYADSGTAAAAARINTSASLTAIHSHPPREDDGNLAVRLSLFDSSSGRVLRTAALRLSTNHFDYSFLRKRIASRLHIKGGARDVKRVYVQEKAPAAAAAASSSSSAAPPPARSNVKLNENNFRSLLFEGCELIVMNEEKSEHPQAILRDSEEDEKMQQSDAIRIDAIGQRQSVSGSDLYRQVMAAGASAPTVQKWSTDGTPLTASQPAVASGINRDRPNWFVSLRIRSPSILKDLVAVQSALTKYDERYSSFNVPAGTFHITLSLLHIANRAEEDVALRVMHELQPRLHKIMTGAEDAQAPAAASAAATAACSSVPALSFRGLSSFGQKVLFADVVRDTARERLNRAALVLKAAFHAAGVGCTEQKRAPQKEARGGKGATFVAAESEVEAEEEGFTPHLTIAKMSRAPAGGGSKFNRGKGANHGKNNAGKSPMQNMGGVQEGADKSESAAGSALPNPFNALALSRDPSNASSAAASDDLPAAAAAGAAAPLVRSTSQIRRIDRDSYASFVAHDFGSEPITALDLCSMMAKKDKDGYYFVKGSIFLDGRPQQPMTATAPDPSVAASAASAAASSSSSSSSAAPFIPGLCYFVCGPLELTEAQFAEHYIPRLREAAADPSSTFVLGLALGADAQALQYLVRELKVAHSRITVHALDIARNKAQTGPLKKLGHTVRATFSNHEECDASMAALAHRIIAWERPAAETKRVCEAKGIVYRPDRISGTTKNLARKLRDLPQSAAAVSTPAPAAAPAPAASAAAPAPAALRASAGGAGSDGRRERRVRQPN